MISVVVMQMLGENQLKKQTMRKNYCNLESKNLFNLLRHHRITTSPHHRHQQTTSKL